MTTLKERGSARDRHGRLWTAKVVSFAEAEQEDFRFWFEDLSPDERVNAVDECLSGCLKTRGKHGAERLRRVYRTIKRK